MKLLLDSRNLILAIDNDIEYGLFGDKLPKWKVGTNMYYIDNNYTVVGVATPPTYVIPNKYFYIDNAYVINPNYSDPNVIEQRIAELERKNALLETQYQNMSEVVDYLLMI